MDKEHSYLAQAWKSYSELSDTYGVGSREAELIWWAYDQLEQLVSDQPFEAIEVILEILRITNDERTLANLAAGPLESLLVKHGKEVIERVTGLATADPQFYELLQGVWGNSVDSDVWKHIERLYKRV
jgi:hypothetical protein